METGEAEVARDRRALEPQDDMMASRAKASKRLWGRGGSGRCKRSGTGCPTYKLIGVVQVQVQITWS